MNNTLEYILKKYNLKFRNQFGIEIPNMDREDLAKLFAELGFNHGVEIGVEKGLYSEVLCEANHDLWLTSIDPWLASAYEPGINGVDQEQSKYDQRYEETQHRLLKFPHCFVSRSTSMASVDAFNDNELDFVYIDGNHDFRHVTEDIDSWIKRVKVGGIVAGHDYAPYPWRKLNHVKRVVDAYCMSWNIRPYFIVGAYENKKGQKRDPFRSWFFVKT